MDQTSGSRLRKWAHNNPVLVALSILAVLLASITTLVGVVGGIKEEIDDALFWRGNAYEKLAGLHAGLSVAVFREQLGAPRFVGVSQNGQLQESLFRGRDYWVQTVHDTSGTVQMYLVTSCDEDFKPTFEIPGIGNLTLRETFFHELVSGREGFSLPRLNYEFSGATANNRYMEYAGAGNPGNYQEFAWGLTDPCPDFEFQLTTQLDLLYDVTGGSRSTFTFPIKGEKRPPAEILSLRRETIANTYGEVPPQRTFREIAAQIPVGVDRIRTRVVDEPDPRFNDKPHWLQRLVWAVQRALDPKCQSPRFKRPLRCNEAPP